MTNLRALVILPLVLLILIATFMIQARLAKQKSIWPGLIFPFIFTGIAAFLAFGATIYDGNIMKIILTFIIYLIPADVHLLILALVRGKDRERRQREIDKMKIHDL